MISAACSASSLWLMSKRTVWLRFWRRGLKTAERLRLEGRRQPLPAPGIRQNRANWRWWGSEDLDLLRRAFDQRELDEDGRAAFIRRQLHGRSEIRTRADFHKVFSGVRAMNRRKVRCRKSSRNGPVVIVRAPRELKDIDVRDAVASVVDGICEEFELSGRAMRDRVCSTRSAARRLGWRGK